jgi:hypothetical protein
LYPQFQEYTSPAKASRSAVLVTPQIRALFEVHTSTAQFQYTGEIARGIRYNRAVDIKESYRRRILATAWAETKKVWTVYRWWIAAAAPASALLLLMWRNGWRSFMNSSDVLINAGGGALLAFAVSFAVSLLRSPKLLDDLRISEKNRLVSFYGGEMAKLTQSLSEASLNLSECRDRLANKPGDEYKLNAVRKTISRLNEVERGILCWLLHQGIATAIEVRDHFGHHLQNDIQGAVEEAQKDGLLAVVPDPRQGGMTQTWKINENYRSAMELVLHELKT